MSHNNHSPKGTTRSMNVGGITRPPSLSRGKTYSESFTTRNRSGSLSKSEVTTSPVSFSSPRTPRRNSIGSLGSIAERKKNKKSYLNKRRGREGAGSRKELIRGALFSKVDAVFGEETSGVADPSDVSFQNENSYLKRLLLSPSASSPSGRKGKKLNVDNCRLQKKKKPQKKLPQIPAVPSANPAAKRIDKSKVAAKLAERSLKDKKSVKSSSAEQNEKRLSTDSTASTAPSESSDCTDSDPLSSNTAAMTIAEAAEIEVDYAELFHSFERVAVDVNFEEPSVDRQRKISFATQAQVATIADLIICSADASSKFEWEDMFYTEEELSDQRHEAFLEMCGLDEE